MTTNRIGRIAVAFATAAIGVVAYTKPQGRAVSLLFDNDADWVHFADHASALLFHEPATSVEAMSICKENNETLFDVDNLSEISGYLSYFRFLGDIDEDQAFWVDSNGTVCSTDTSQADCLELQGGDPALPFLCTNSAPHTSQVDTDFTTSPKTDVTSNGTVFTGTRDHLTFRFMGIPYAQAPTGSLRFKYAQPWSGKQVDATALKPGCLQTGSFWDNNSLGLNPWGLSEDCLYLNVYTPYIPSDVLSENSPALKPVLFWMHGGGNTNGLGSDARFDGGPLTSRTDSVLVTINYRLNIFGFLGLNDGVVIGNYALTDKITALQWVKNNIAAFGGDPEKVTIFGQSAGGWSVIDLVKSPPAKGLFRSAISQSGGSSRFVTAEQAANATAPALAQFCNETGAERLECLQDLPAQTLLNISTTQSWPSVQDDIYVLEPAVEQVGKGAEAINSVPFLAGFMPDEGQSLLAEAISPNDTDFNQTLTKAVGATVAQAVLSSGLWEITDEFTPYNATINVDSDLSLTCPAEQMISAAADSGAFPALYVYVMRHGYGQSFLNPYGLCSFPVGQPQVPSYLCHGADIYEVFGTYHLFDRPVRVDEDIFYTALVQDIWGAFARSGNPNPDLDYLRARGSAYNSTLAVLVNSGWIWPQFDDGETSGQVAALNYPGLAVDEGMPDEKNGRCAVVMGAASLLSD
ncbi:hypothetical protein PQX77_017877 [Marasmius sp. AFHP31]|nr:hypothetical protein PQX77_017877 [Marasmius sp. AFHP31]